MQHLSKHSHQFTAGACVHTQYLKTHKALHMLSNSCKALNSAYSKHLGQLSNEDCSLFSSWHHNVHLILCAIQLPALRKNIPDFKNFFFNICLLEVGHIFQVPYFSWNLSICKAVIYDGRWNFSIHRTFSSLLPQWKIAIIVKCRANSFCPVISSHL